jgi:hypothetical protein
MEIVVIFYGIWSILKTFSTFSGHRVYFLVIWYISSRFGMLCQEKSGNPASDGPGRLGEREIAIETGER